MPSGPFTQSPLAHTEVPRTHRLFTGHARRRATRDAGHVGRGAARASAGASGQTEAPLNHLAGRRRPSRAIPLMMDPIPTTSTRPPALCTPAAAS